MTAFHVNLIPVYAVELLRQVVTLENMQDTFPDKRMNNLTTQEVVFQNNTNCFFFSRFFLFFYFPFPGPFFALPSILFGPVFMASAQMGKR